jgi:hypothetical protein
VTTATGPLSHRIRRIKLHPTLPVVLDITGVTRPSSILIRLQNENLDHALICRTPQPGVVEMNKVSATDLIGIQTQEKISGVKLSYFARTRNIFSSILAVVFFLTAGSLSALTYTNVIDLRIVQTNSIQNNEVTFDLNQISSGVYFAHLFGKGASAVQKFCVK